MIYFSFQNSINKSEFPIFLYDSDNNTLYKKMKSIVNINDNEHYLLPELLFDLNGKWENPYYSELMNYFNDIIKNINNEDKVKNNLDLMASIIDSIDISPIGKDRKLLDVLRPNNKSSSNSVFQGRKGCFRLVNDWKEYVSDEFDTFVLSYE